MDLNLTVLLGRLATEPEIRTFDSGTKMIRLLVTTRVNQPRKRVDVIPVTYWPADPNDPVITELADVTKGQRVWLCGSVQRRFWESPDGRRSRIELVAEQVTVKVDELAEVTS